MNYTVLSILATWNNTQSVSRSFTQRNHYITRFYGFASWVGISLTVLLMISPFLASSTLDETFA